MDKANKLIIESTDSGVLHIMMVLGLRDKKCNTSYYLFVEYKKLIHKNCESRG